MKIVLNPTKILYLNRDGSGARLGNFPETGKSINFDENRELSKIFKILVEPVEIDFIVSLICELCGATKEDANGLIQFLLSERIVVTEEDKCKLVKSERFSRQNLFYFMTANKNKEKQYDLLKTKNILILGIGGIGSIVAELLVRAGFENLILVDNDNVEESNLIRQLAYLTKDIGRMKTEVLKDRLLDINPNVNIETINLFIQETNQVDKLLERSDFVVCTLDKPIRIARRIVNDSCVKNNKPVIFAGFAEHVGMVGPFIVPNKTACLRCIEQKEEDEALGNVGLSPSFGPLCGIVANIVSLEIINFFIRFKRSNLIGKTLMYNVITNKTKMIKWKRNNKCKLHGEVNEGK